MRMRAWLRGHKNKGAIEASLCSSLIHLAVKVKISYLKILHEDICIGTSLALLLVGRYRREIFSFQGVHEEGAEWLEEI